MSTFGRIRKVLTDESLPVPSLEDELYATTQSTERLNDAENVDGEIDTLIRRSDTASRYLEEKRPKGIVIEPEEVDPEDLKNIVAMAELLGEGTGFTYGEVMPSLESGCSSTVALEGIGKYLDIFFDGVKGLLIKLMDLISEYWQLFVTRLGALINMSKLLKDKTRDLQGRHIKNEKFSLDRPLYRNGLYCRGKFPVSFRAVDENFKELVDIGGSVFSSWGRTVTETGILVLDVLGDANIQEIEPALDRCNQITRTMWSGIDNNFKKDIELMGAGQLKYTSTFTEDDLNGSPVEIARKLQQTRFELESVPIESDTTDLKFKTLTLREIDDLMDDIIRMAESLHRYIKQNKLPQLDRKSREFVRRAEQNIGNAERNFDGSVYRNRLDFTFRYATTYAKWVKAPSMRLSGMMVTTARAIQSLAGDSLTQYE